MDSAERVALGERRRNIFANFCNGIPIEDLMPVFKASRLEIEQAIVFVAKKIQESRFSSNHNIRPVLLRLNAELGKPAGWRDKELIADLSDTHRMLTARSGTPVDIDLMTDIQANRIELLVALGKLGPNYLSSELILPRISLQKLDGSPGIAEEVNRRVTLA